MTLQLAMQGLAIGLVNGVLYVLTALGLTLIYGILHIVNFAHGEVFMLGAMAVYFLVFVAMIAVLIFRPSGLLRDPNYQIRRVAVDRYRCGWRGRSVIRMGTRRGHVEVAGHLFQPEHLRVLGGIDRAPAQAPAHAFRSQDLRWRSGWSYARYPGRRCLPWHSRI